MFIKAKDMTVDGYTYVKDGKIMLPKEMIFSKYLSEKMIEEIIEGFPCIVKEEMEDLINIPMKELPAYIRVSDYMDFCVTKVNEDTFTIEDFKKFVDAVIPVLSKAMRNICESIERVLQFEEYNCERPLEEENRILTSHIYIYLGIIVSTMPFFDWSGIEGIDNTSIYAKDLF
ncbi:MAG: hypothetical protein K5644_02645 [Lachnospiraceae bacterium]|nr:hypothetical protein [Lachnospiraceae bacterium]